jgi:hypothetical protein
MDQTLVDYQAWAREEAGIVSPKVRVSAVVSLSSPQVRQQPSSSSDHDLRLAANRHQQRGLYATETIYPGERILFVPSSLLLGADYLRNVGSQLLLGTTQALGEARSDDDPGLRQPVHDATAGNDATAPAAIEDGAIGDDGIEDRDVSARATIDARLGEKILVASIEMLRRILLQEDDDDDDDDTTGHSKARNGPDKLVREVAQEIEYEWRDDDAVAVYLACCRSLLREDPEYCAFEHSENDESFTDLHHIGGRYYRTSDEALPAMTDAVLVVEAADFESVDDVVSEESYPDDVGVPQPSAKSFPSLLPHVAALPTSFPTCPLYYSEREMARIDGTNCAEYAKRMLRQFDSDYSKLAQVLRAFDDSHPDGLVLPTSPCRTFWNDSCPRSDSSKLVAVGDKDVRACTHQRLPVVHLHERVTFDAYQWALCNIYSRSSDFAVRSPQHEGSDSCCGLVGHRRRIIAPLFDMMNHDFSSDVTHSLDWGDDGGVIGEGLSVFNGPNRTIEAGQEVCLSYGNFSNEKLLLIYGFALDRNPHDAVSIYAPLNPEDPLYFAKRRLLQSRCGIEDPNVPHLLKSVDHVGVLSNEVPSVLPRSLLSVLRLIGVQSAEGLMSVATQESEDEGREDGAVGDACSSGIGMISVENERSALLALKQALYSMSRQIALNLISDEGLRQGAPFPEPRADSSTTNDDDGSASSWIACLNESNARILCQSEYQILQHALAELYSRLSLLEGANIDQQ